MINRFTFTLMLYGSDPILDALFTQAMDSGLISAKPTNHGYYLLLVFKDGSIIKVWNANKYYAWLSRGVFCYPDDSIEPFFWDSIRPRKSTMARLYKLLGTIKY
jgi:hypothetical protein